MRSSILSVAVAGVVASSWAGLTHAALAYRTVAISGIAFPDYSGSTSPATSAGQTWGTTNSANAFSNAVLNASGQVVFQGSLIGTGVTSNNNDRGIWSEGSGSLQLLARRADPAFTPAGTPSDTGVNFSSTALGPNINSAGDVVFLSTLSGTGITTTGTSSNNNAQFTSIGGVTRKTLQLNDTVNNNGADTNIRGLGALPVINASGTYAFAATLSPATSTPNSIYTYSPSTGLTKVIAFGDTAPGTDLGSGLATFATSTSYGTPALNSHGALAFLATFTTGSAGVTSGVNDRGVWIVSPDGSPQLIARAGSAAPGTAGANFSTTISNTPGFNSSGVVAFSASLVTAGSITSANNAGVWRGSTPSNLSLVVQKGSQVADLPTGVLYNSFNATMISKSGLLAFTTSLTGADVSSASDTALILETSSGLNTFAREGSAAPGGKLFGNFSSATYFALNAQGHVAFLSSLTDSLGGSTTANALFAQDFDGTLLLVAQTGLPFEVAPGLFKTPSSITFNNISVAVTGGDDGRASAWNDNHQLAFTLLFSDGSSGVFSTSIPEPTTPLLLTALTLPLTRRRRTH